MANFIGRGWQWPLRVNPRGSIALAPEERDIEEAIGIILSTDKGERVMRPHFGSDIHELVFGPSNATTYGRLESYVQEALRLWEPRIEVLEVNVDTSQHDDGVLLVHVGYRIRATNSERNLVYPFYLIPREET
jgi:phage baseplate assembly protein W